MADIDIAVTSPNLDDMEHDIRDVTSAPSGSSSSTLPKGRKLPRRPARSQFDSLQELLEEAGYKETRIYTPQNMPKPPMRMESNESTSTQATVRADDNARNARDAGTMTKATAPDAAAVQQAKSAASTAAWFSLPWSAPPPGPSNQHAQQSQARPNGMRRKASEPALPRKSSLSRLFGWGKAPQSTATPRDPTKPNAASIKDSTGQTEDSVVTTAPARDETESPSVSEASSSRPTLRHAESTHQLWQASMRHHKAASQQRTLNKSRSFPAQLGKTAEDDARPPINGAKLVGAVGMRSSKEMDTPPDGLFLRHSRSRKTDLRDAFDLEEAKAQALPSSDTSQDLSQINALLTSSDSVCSIIDSYINDSRTTLFDHIEQMASTPAKAPQASQESAEPVQYTTLFFASAASPVITRNDAVVMRNTDCLEQADLANPQDSPARDGQPKRRPMMRKMSSVGALQLALRRMEANDKDDDESEQISGMQGITESGSGESITQDDFLNATTTVLDGQVEVLKSQTMTAPIEAGVPQRAPTPTLVITSPTGVNPPQPLVLDGVEFEPRSVSPNAKGTTVIYKPKKRAGWKVTTVGVAPSVVPDERGRSASQQDAVHDTPGKRKTSSRRRKMRVGSNRVADGTLAAPTLKRRAGATQSHGDLRGMATSSATTRALVYGRDIAGDDLRRAIGKTSGSEDVRQLHRSMLERAGQPPIAVHKNPTLDTSDDEDPFCDPVVTKVPGPLESTLEISEADSAWHSSSMDSEPVRAPLGEITSTNDSTITMASVDSLQGAGKVDAKPKPVPSKPSKTLTRMRSGVGLACLVDIDPARAAKEASDKAANGRSRTSSNRRSRNGSRRASLASMSSASSAETLALGSTRNNNQALGNRNTASNGSLKRVSASKAAASAGGKAKNTVTLASQDSDGENRNPQLYDSSPTARAASQRNAILKKRSSRSAMPVRTAGDPVRRAN